MKFFACFTLFFIISSKNYHLNRSRDCKHKFGFQFDQKKVGANEIATKFQIAGAMAEEGADLNAVLATSRSINDDMGEWLRCQHQAQRHASLH